MSLRPSSMQRLTALAALAFLTACGGGGDATAPGSSDTTAPTVTITDSEASATATGPVTFTFTFSEVVSGFVDTDITVTGGSKGSFNMAGDGRSATLVVTPTANSAGTLNVSVAAAAFVDAANNANSASASATQAYDTRGPSAPSGSTGSCTAAPCINFAEANVALVGFEGLENGVQVVNDPADATNKVAKLTKEAADQPWAGATIHLNGSAEGAATTVTRIDPARGITLRVYSPAVGETIMVKIEDGSNSNAFVEASATSTKAGEWETLSFSYATANSGTTYNKISVFPAFMVQANKIFYIDEFKYTAKSADVVVATPVTFSSGFTSNVLSASGGAIVHSAGSDLDGWSCTGGPDWCGSGAGGSGANTSMYGYYQTPSVPSGGVYNQIEIFGPGVTGFNAAGDTAGVTINGQTKINFNFNPNPEWFNSSTKNLGVVLTLGKRYTVGGNTCRIELHGVMTPTAVAATAYSMNLANEFRVAQDCGAGIADVAGALAASPVISAVKFIGAGGGAAITGRNNVKSGANTSVLKDGAVYPTTVALTGAITFD